jgi:hypothetical protein
MSQAKINWRPPSDLAPVGVSLRDTCRLGIGSCRGPTQSLRRLEHAACLLGLGIVWLHASHLKLDIFIILSNFACKSLLDEQRFLERTAKVCRKFY